MNVTQGLLPIISQSEPEVDSRDASPAILPIHQCSAEAMGVFRTSSVKPRLTLSAFRRPEETINLTGSDTRRRLEADYDLRAPGCGVLGHGAFSTVRLAIRKSDGVRVAVKSIAKHDALRSRRLRLGGSRHLEEWEILRRMQDHPYIITLLDVYETQEEIQLVTEYCAGGELFNAIKQKRSRSQGTRKGQYSESHAARITCQILRALADLHAQGIVHRDVKPENILLAGDDDKSLSVKLCDFGVARCLHRETDHESSEGDTSPLTPVRARSYSAVGSDYYIAPEVCYGGSYDTATDIYSLGVTVYILLCGFAPVFSGSEAEQVVFPAAYWHDISEDAKNLLRKMLDADPSVRISARDALGDKWIINNVKKRHREVLDSPAQATLNLSLLRTRLFNSFNDVAEVPVPSDRVLPTQSAVGEGGRKRSRYERRTSSCLIALADLYRDVAASPNVAAMTSPNKAARKESFVGTTPSALSV